MADDLQARFEELEAENAALRERADRAESALSESLEQQTATAEILRVIASSRSQSQLSDVFDAVAERASHLCGATSARIYLIEGNQLRVVSSVLEPDSPAVAPGLPGTLGHMNAIDR